MLTDIGYIIHNFKIDGGVKVYRSVAGSRVDGHYKPGTKSVFTMDPVSVQPLGAREIQMLPEGVRTRQNIVLYSIDELRTAGVQENTDADVVEYLGKKFEVHTVEDWADNGIYYKSVAAKVDSP